MIDLKDVFPKLFVCLVAASFKLPWQGNAIRNRIIDLGLGAKREDLEAAVDGPFDKAASLALDAISVLENECGGGRPATKTGQAQDD